ncbi:MAG: TonB-dependent receptor, partial [Bryobacteraceae bacterium]|nr:TonB-dependent receptor [Bryobacteraceae bacterium]
MKYLHARLLAVLVSLLAAQTAGAQVIYGSVVGSVTDQSGAVVPNVSVTLTSRETNQQRETKSDDSGNYNFTNLLPGNYELKASGSGFRTANRTSLDVLANNVARVDFAMEVGQITETVNVDGQAVLLQTERSDTSTTITSKPIQALPLNVYRNYQALINLVPGATPAGFQNSSTDTPGRSLRTNVNGTPANMNTTRVDGAINVNIWLPHHNAYVAPSETVAEVNVSTTALDAEQGMAGGAAVTVITASGTNEFHGAAWEYHNNQEMKSRPYFLAATQRNPRDTLNIFGGKLGGPILRNKLFFFGHYEGTRQRIGGSGLFSVPRADLRTGDFRNALFGANTTPTIIYDPRTGNPDGSGRTPFPNNVIPAERVSSVARQVLAGLPLPTNSGQQNNFSGAGTGKFDRNNYDYKINYTRNDRHQIWGKSSFLKAIVGGQAVFGELVGPGLGGDPATGDTFTQLHTVGHSWSLTPNLLLDQTFGYTRMSQNVVGNDFGTNYGTDVFRIPGTNGPDPRQSGLPVFVFDYTNVGQTLNWTPVFRTERSFTHDTNLTLISGKHDIRFGFNLVRHALDHWQPEIENPRGQFNFGGGVTSLLGGAAPNYFNSLAAFLLGEATRVSKSLQYIEMSGRETQTGFYVRDRWQLSRRVTVNLGVRMNYFPLMTRANSGLELYDPNTNVVSFTGYGNVPTNQGISINSLNFAPNFGFAWRVTEKTVVRSAYGLTTDPLPFSRPLRGFYPSTIASILNPDNSFSSVRNVLDGIPPIVGPDLSLGSGQLPPTVDMRSPWGKINRGYIQSWNLTVEREILRGTSASVAYVGTQATNMLADRNINSGLPGTNTNQLPLARRFGRTVNTRMWDGWLSSNYHSFQFALNKQFSQGFFLKGAYTLAKAINMADDNGWVEVNWNSPEVIGRNRARAGYDRTHVLQLAYIYELPFGKGKQWASSGPLSWIVGNWDINGIFYRFSGTPFSVIGGGACNCPGNLQTANQVKPDVERTARFGPGQQYYDNTAFASGPANQFGSTGRNILTGPGRIGTDVSLHRVFRIGERFRFEL